MSSRTRRSALLLLVGVVPLAATYACSDFSGDTTAANDAGADVAVDAPAPDASPETSTVDGGTKGCAVHAIATGYVHSCAVFGPTRAVACWGDNSSAESGAELDAGRLRTTAGLVQGLDHVEQLALGQLHSCALKDDGTVWCWGANEAGELGNAATTPTKVAVPTSAVFQLEDAVQIAAGYYHTCALLSTGTVKCWGANGSGQLGDGTTGASFSPISAAVSGAVEVGVGAAHSCARLADGGVVCWGDNYFGELGTGFDDAGPDARAPAYAHTTPQLVEAGAALRLSVGSVSTCAQFHVAPFLRCWGDNYARILVPNSGATLLDKPTGVTLPFVPDGGDVAIGGYQTCAVADDRSLFCWGLNVYGQAGPATSSGGPSLVPAAGVVDHVATGYLHTCTLSDASVSCFGWNEYAQLGQGTSDVVVVDGGNAPAHPIPMKVTLPCP